MRVYPRLDELRLLLLAQVARLLEKFTTGRRRDVKGYCRGDGDVKALRKTVHLHVKTLVSHLQGFRGQAEVFCAQDQGGWAGKLYLFKVSGF